MRLLLVLVRLLAADSAGDCGRGVMEALPGPRLFWFGISSLLLGLPILIKAYDWSTGIVADSGRCGKLGAAVFQLHACGLPDVIAANLHAMLARHIIFHGSLFGARIDGVLWVARL